MLLLLPLAPPSTYHFLIDDYNCCFALLLFATLRYCSAIVVVIAFDMRNLKMQFVLLLIEMKSQDQMTKLKKAKKTSDDSDDDSDDDYDSFTMKGHSDDVVP